VSLSTAERAAIAHAVAARVAGLAGVAGLSAGHAVEAATYYPGGKTVGVAVHDETVTVHVVIDALPVHDVAERVRRAAEASLAELGRGGRVDVVIEDVVVAGLPVVGPDDALPRPGTSGQRPDAEGRPG